MQRCQQRGAQNGKPPSTVDRPSATSLVISIEEFLFQLASCRLARNACLQPRCGALSGPVAQFRSDKRHTSIDAVTFGHRQLLHLCKVFSQEVLMILHAVALTGRYGTYTALT